MRSVDVNFTAAEQTSDWISSGEAFNATRGQDTALIQWDDAFVGSIIVDVRTTNDNGVFETRFGSVADGDNNAALVFILTGCQYRLRASADFVGNINARLTVGE